MKTEIINSIKNNYKGIILVLFAAFFSSLAQLLWKFSSTYNHLYIFIFLGFVVYGLTTIITIVAYKFGNLSVLHPFFSFSFIFALLFSHFFLNEIINIYGILGIIFIITGSILLGIGDF